MGMIARSLIVDGLARRRPGLAQCYEEFSSRTPGRRVSLAVRFVIDPQGMVACAEVTRSDSEDDRFDACIADEVARARFAATGRGAVTVNYPYTFAPSEP
jgi:TonB family protein